VFTFCKLSARRDRSIHRKQRITHNKEERAKEDARAQKTTTISRIYEQSKKQNDVCVKVLVEMYTYIYSAFYFVHF
jgi:hypothetical protein